MLLSTQHKTSGVTAVSVFKCGMEYKIVKIDSNNYSYGGTNKSDVKIDLCFKVTIKLKIMSKTRPEIAEITK